MDDNIISHYRMLEKLGGLRMLKGVPKIWWQSVAEESEERRTAGHDR